MPVQSNTLDFSGQNVFAGFDAHLKDWKVSIMVNDIHHKTFSQDPDPKQLAAYLARNFPGANYYSAYEAGFCGFWIHHELVKLGVNSIVVNPADIPTTGKEIAQKEDRRDSLKIVKSLRAGLLQPIHVLQTDKIENRSLLRRRQNLTKDLARTKNRLKSYLHFTGVQIPKHFENPSKTWTGAYIQWLERLQVSERSKQNLGSFIQQGKQIKDLKKAVTRQLMAIAESTYYQTNFRLLRTVPGIGVIVAISILLEIDDITRFKNVDSFCSFLGLVPSTKSSGEKEKTGNITSRSCKVLRNMLIESAWIAVRRDPALMQKFILLQERMNKNRAIVRVAKSLAARILHVLKHQAPYQLATVMTAK